MGDVFSPHEIRGAGTRGDDVAAHVLVVDDDTRLRKLLRRFLTEQGFRITVAANAAEARAAMQRFAFDLIVLDVMMPGESGLSLTRTLRQSNGVPILLLTARGEPEERIEGLEAGADDYLAKPFEPRELVARIRSILRRAPPSQDDPPQAALALGACRFDLERGELMRAGRPVRLTTAEERLLRIFAVQPGRPVSREDLSLRLGLNGNLRSVDVQVARLRRKIEDDPKLPRFVQTVRGQGYVLRPG